ncbi:MAG: type II toxin-antitoxin system RelE/ParE family toxin [Verrucomicrobiae bacterium]|nr:type II toxin-antitoxin system RelE/ParE family toxin [Verrucomicrobiae bacterium]
MKPVEFHPNATAELDAAVGYYEQCAPGLGIDLRKDVETAVQKIQAAPLRCSPYTKRTRRFLIRRFSYLVVFLELADKILIVAVAHGKRHPGYWHDRI